MNFEEIEPGIQVLTLAGDYDLSHVEAVLSEFKKLERARVAIVDLSQTAYMDSTILGLLVQLHGRCKTNDKAVYFVRPNPGLARIFQISGLDQVLTMVPSVKDAVKAAKKR